MFCRDFDIFPVEPNWNQNEPELEPFGTEPNCLFLTALAFFELDTGAGVRNTGESC